MALASALPGVQVWATDASADALAVARANLAGLGSAARAVRLTQGDWFDALPDELRGRLRVVVTNPPYVAEREVEELAREVVAHEPRSALVSGPTGLECIERIVGEAPGWLETPGALVVEIAPHQAAAAIEWARAAGFTDVRIERDLALRERVLVAGIS
jgi:release factor glutamine methyltransferase